MVGSRPVIVISSVDIVRDLFDKRGAIYSDRPEAFAAKHVPVSKLRMAFMVSGPCNTKTYSHSSLMCSSAILLCGVHCAK